MNRIQSSRRLEREAQRNVELMWLTGRMTPDVAQARTERLQDKIDALKAQMEALKHIGAELEQSPDKQVSLTDPDARSMKTRGSGIVGYNVQAAVDAKHHLIVARHVNA